MKAILLSLILIGCNPSIEERVKRAGGIDPIACVNVADNIRTCKDARTTTFICIIGAECVKLEKITSIWSRLNAVQQAESNGNNQ